MNVEIDPTIMWKMGQKTLPELAKELSKAYRRLEDAGSDFDSSVKWYDQASNMVNAFNSMRFDTLGIISTSTWNIYAVAEALCEMAGEFAEADGDAASELNGLISDDDYYEGKKIGDGPPGVQLPTEPDEDEIPSFS